ncbi:Iron(3+)-hydroxamate import ATP-binding protein FhuC [Roseovarius albus]|uniref:Iron(3+)-hydroxamate import ATP-binding protein FhuC n=1 Tax=Roseovarius albus TaxID=1247867 RepID=A0A1X7A0A0_9RHOB|nr:ABC transporter ATP-binding protein [Roseovarius albus]SLN66309.1 Iron(3+)-hydroxamate import ATP-binding protein FhuC [Roseovarius albus]
MTAASLRVDQVTFGPNRRGPLLLDETSFDLKAGQVMGVVGPNGAGKTTLLRLIYGFHRPLNGQILIDGDALNTLPPRQVARKVAAVLQEQPTDFALTVREIVALGRVPHRHGFARPGQHDAQMIDKALDRLGLHNLAGRSLSTLSGGERQRVMVARALAQEPQILVLDEPTNHLDIRHQLEVLQLISELDLTIITSLHDLNLASDICDRILVLKNGHPQGFGHPDDVLQDAIVADTFQVHARREELSISRKPYLSYQLPPTTSPLEELQ